MAFARSVIVVAFMGIAACAGGDAARRAPGRAPFVDDFGDTVAVGPAHRIVSLNPVTTEFLFAAGRGASVVGRTHWDHYPPAADSVPDLGNGIEPNVEVVLGARPDLVMLYASAGNRRAAVALRRGGVRTLSIRTDHLDDLRRLADAYVAVTGDSAARIVADTALASVEAVRRMPRPAKAPRLVWHQGDPPIYVAGKRSFQGELIEVAGGVNVFGDIDQVSPQVAAEEIVRRNPDFLLVGPQSAREIPTKPEWSAIPAVRARHFLVVDTALVGRPGVRIGEAAHFLRRLIVGDSTR